MKTRNSFIVILLIGVALALALGITYAGASTGGSATRPDVGAAPLAQAPLDSSASAAAAAPQTYDLGDGR